MKKVFILLQLLLFVALAHAQELTKEAIMQKVSTGHPFTLVFLKSGQSAAVDDSTMNALQMEHLLRLFTLEKEGKISVFGPVTSDKTYKGIIVFNDTDKYAVKAELEKDPYIEGGFLTFELYDFFCIPGQKIP